MGSRRVERRFNSPSGHCPESRASQRSWPIRPVYFRLVCPVFPSEGLTSRRNITEPAARESFQAGDSVRLILALCEVVGDVPIFLYGLDRSVGMLSISACCVARRIRGEPLIPPRLTTKG